MMHGWARWRNEDILDQKQDKYERNSRSNLVTDCDTSHSGRIPGRIQGSGGSNFFFKPLKQSGQQSGQELAEFSAGFGTKHFQQKCVNNFFKIHVYIYLISPEQYE